jgi:hypothetical protein
LAVGSAGAVQFAEAWNGSRWTIVRTQTPSMIAYVELNSISCTGPAHCLAVGYETSTRYHADVTFA